MYVFIAILLIVVIIFGAASGMQSFATAQQAQAQIEVARLGQINAAANMVSIITTLFLTVIILALIAAVVWLLYKRSVTKRAGPVLARPTPATLPREQDPIAQLIELEKLKLLRDLRGSNHLQLTDSQPAQQPENDPLHWLRE